LRELGAIARLHAWRAQVYSLRLLRHAYRFARNMSLDAWRRATGERRRVLTWTYSNQYLLTQQELLEPRFEHARGRGSPVSRASGYVPSADGLSRQ
jgi:hypothetical protein